MSFIILDKPFGKTGNKTEMTQQNLRHAFCQMLFFFVRCLLQFSELSPILVLLQ